MKFHKWINLAKFVDVKEQREFLHYIHVFKDIKKAIATDGVTLACNPIEITGEEYEKLPDVFCIHAEEYTRCIESVNHTMVIELTENTITYKYDDKTIIYQRPNVDSDVVLKKFNEAISNKTKFITALDVNLLRKFPDDVVLEFCGNHEAVRVFSYMNKELLGLFMLKVLK